MSINVPDVEVLHQAEEPSARILASLLEAFPGCSSNLLANSIAADSRDAELTLFGGQPSGLGGVVGEEEESEAGDESGYAAFNDEQPEKMTISLEPERLWRFRNVPLPTCDSLDPIESRERRGSDEARAAGAHNLAGIEQGDSRCELLSGIVDREEVECAGIERLRKE